MDKLRNMRRWVLTAVAVMLVVPAGAAGLARAATPVLRSGSELDYPPFALVRADGAADGFSVELLKKVANVTGLNIRFLVAPWHTIKQDLMDGRLDVLPFVSYSSERDRVFDFSAAYLRLHGTIFVRKDEDRIAGVADLKGKSVIVMRGDNAHEYTEKNKLTDRLVLTDSYAKALRLLSAGRHDAVLMLHLVGLQLIKQLNIDNVVSIDSFETPDLKPVARPLSGYEQKFCFAVQEGDKVLLARLNEGLAIVMADGTYNRLYEKWFGPILPGPPFRWGRFFGLLAAVLVPILFLGAMAGLWYLRREVANKTQHLRASEKQFRTLFNVAAIPLCLVDAEGTILDLNATFIDLFGYTRADIHTLEQWWQAAYPDAGYRQWVIRTWEVAVEKARREKALIESAVYRVTCRNGDIRQVQISGTTFDDKFLATFIDLTERLAMEESIKASELYIRNIFDALEEAVFVVSPQGDLVRMNKATRDIFGYTAEELAEASTAVLHVDADHRARFEAHIQAAFKQGRSVVSEFKSKRKNGDIFDSEYDVSLLKDDSGKVRGVVNVVRDISHRKEAEAALERLLADLKRSNDELQQFAYVASHDLQEPLRAVVGFLQLLQSRYENRLDDKGNHYIDRAVSAGYRMQTLINDLLELSRVNTRALSIEAVDLNDVVAEAGDNLNSIIQEKNAHLTGDPLPTIKVDRTQLVALFQNLIANALKYNQDPQPEIRVGYREEEDTHCFFVRDNGIGIAPKFHERIFMIFQRLHTRQEYSGTGIGLALCKKIVERHNGSIWVESAEKEGSTFYCSFPKERSAI